MNWEEWYKEQNNLKQWAVKWFWSLSDYGRSAGRILGWFFMLSFLFAAIYANFPCVVKELVVVSEGDLFHRCLLITVRPIYFSIVTMTTLGFGDMHANPQSVWGHILLTIQVLLGYVMLGALVTRFAVLFTAGGPAGTFADEEEDGSNPRPAD